jgi:hypothetical protein
MKCWTWEFTAQCSRVIIVVVQVAAVVEALAWKEREDKTQFTSKIGGKN